MNTSRLRGFHMSHLGKSTVCVLRGLESITMHTCNSNLVIFTFWKIIVQKSLCMYRRFYITFPFLIWWLFAQSFSPACRRLMTLVISPNSPPYLIAESDIPIHFSSNRGTSKNNCSYYLIFTNQTFSDMWLSLFWHSCVNRVTIWSHVFTIQICHESKYRTPSWTQWM